MLDAFDQMLKPLTREQNDKLRKIDQKMDESLRIFEETYQEIGQARCILLRAEFYFENLASGNHKKKFNELLQDLKYCQEVFEGQQNLSHQVQSLIYLAIIYHDNKDYQCAKDSIQIAIELSKEI